MRTGRVEIDLPGRPISIETGRLARQANGAVVVRCGDTVVLVTATMSSAPREGIDFFPLTCDYEEKMFAAGKIPGGFFKREGRPGERAILTARLMDRPIRPLFPKGFRNDVQVIATVLSTDQDNTPDILAVTGAGAALGISDIPFDGPIAAVRIGLIDGQLTVNPPQRAIDEKTTDLDLVVAGAPVPAARSRSSIGEPAASSTSRTAPETRWTSPVIPLTSTLPLRLQVTARWGARRAR